MCHSDLHVLEEDLGFTPPFTLGHENAGWVAALGQGVTAFKEGDASRSTVHGDAAAATPVSSMENDCENWAEMGSFGGGLGSDGGMAEYVLVPSARLLIGLGVPSPAKAAPLSDAALTPYHAIKRALPSLHADSTVVVLGVGGGRNSVWATLGLGGGHHDFHHGSTPYGTAMSIPYWRSRIELMEVIAMARAGRIHAETTDFPLGQAVDVYRQLKACRIRGRAVLVPDAS